eukprot:gene9194-6471_t
MKKRKIGGSVSPSDFSNLICLLPIPPQTRAYNDCFCFQPLAPLGLSAEGYPLPPPPPPPLIALFLALHCHCQVSKMLEETAVPSASSISRTTGREDPWPQMELQVSAMLSDLSVQLTRLRETPQPTIKVRNDALAAIAAVTESVADMRFAFDTAMEHPESFHITTDEMMTRSERLRTWEREVARAQEVGEWIMAQQRAAESAHSQQNDETIRENNEFLQRELGTQRQITQVDDETLDRLHGGLQRVKVTAQNIGDELEVQDHIIDDVDQGMTRIQSRMESVMKKVGTLLDSTSDRGKFILIGVLLLILIVLIGFMV